jgi:general secretion pathway protein E
MSKPQRPSANATAPAAPVPSAPQVVEELVHQAERSRASDIHLQMQGKNAQVWFRLDGVMTPVQSLSEEVADRVFGRIKYLARLKTYQESLPQDGRIDKSDVGATHDIRVATYPTVTGEKIVLRLFGEAVAPSLAELGLAPSAIAVLEQRLRQPSGLVLLTGPAGSGKTTTIYAGLKYLTASGGRHIITVEDPVEQMVAGVMQTEVNEARGLTFAAAARHLLRQDPQVLAIGEIRDEETANLVVRAALTGHLVISTLHAGSCRGVLERLLVMCPDHYAVVSALSLILNQRLVRRVCRQCAGAGCESCLHTGFHGRVPVVECFPIDDDTRCRLRGQGPAVIQPSPALEDALEALVQANLTNARERERVLGR